MQERTPGSASWKELLSSPPRGAHVVQIYDRNEFLAAGVAHFAAEGLLRGDAVLLFGTPEHLKGIRGELAGKGVDVDAATRNGQVSLNDVHTALSQVAPNGSVDPVLYDAVAGPMLERACSDPRFSGVRWWGEISSTLYHRGDRHGSLRAEACADALNLKHGAMLLCSSFCDRFDAAGYDGIFVDMCHTHTHVIPTDDYVVHRLAVNRAIADVIGEMRGALLQSLWTWKGPRCVLPSSQALLFWLRDTMPDQFHSVLARARMYHAAEKRISP